MLSARPGQARFSSIIIVNRLRHKFRCKASLAGLHKAAQASDTKSQPLAHSPSITMDKPTLESLPIELQVQILIHLPDTQSLHSIASSSTALYQAYILARKDALPRILHTQSADREKVIALLDDWRRSNEIRRLGKRSSVTQTYPDQPVDLNETQALLKLHKVAVWLLDDYCQTARCPFWMDPDVWRTQVLSLKLSKLEKQRCFRTIYRLQTFSNLFGQIKHPVDDMEHIRPIYWSYKLLEDSEIWRLFFGPLSPWECDEFACLWKHFLGRLELTMKEIRDNLKSYGPMNNGKLPEALSATLLRSSTILDIDDLNYDEEIGEGMVSFGPTFLYRFLREKDFMTRRNTVFANRFNSNPWYPAHISYDVSRVLPLLSPSDRFYLGTDVIALAHLEQMDENEPLYEDFYDTFSPNFRRTDWAYAIWDAERLLEWEGNWGAPLWDFN
ncbi:uncharacterized protein BDV14DRAFT_197048 [Aspergillus stella-maris]|uniref:uncharacterized protein n=1 Tax=Aspergillus stella-maris TaxID=1810926 RepID=UPI003CCDC4D4